MPTIESSQAVKKLCQLHIIDNRGQGDQALDPTDEEARFLLKTGIAFTINFYVNSTREGREKHILRRDSQGNLCVKKENAYVPIKDLVNTLEWDSQQDKIVSKDNRNIVWGYCGPDGLIPCDRFHYGTLTPIEVLDPEDHQRIRQLAASFSGSENEVDPGQAKEYVLQIITTQHLHTDDWLTHNLFEAYPQHTGFRLIDRDGKLYSFGLQMEKPEWQSIVNEQVFLKTVTAQVASFDYEEARPFYKKIITSIPLTQERFASICNYVTELNQQGVRLNFKHQNCVSLSRELLRRAGCSYPKKVAVYDFMGGLLPRIEMLPGPVGDLARTMIHIYDLACGILKNMQWLSSPVNCVMQPITGCLDYVATKVRTLFWNTIMWQLGGDQMKDPLPEGSVDNPNNSDGITIFSRIYRSWTDLFDEKLLTGDSHLALIQWQRQFASTIERPFNGTVKLYF